MYLRFRLPCIGERRNAPQYHQDHAVWDRGDDKPTSPAQLILLHTWKIPGVYYITEHQHTVLIPLVQSPVSTALVTAALHWLAPSAICLGERT